MRRLPILEEAVPDRPRSSVGRTRSINPRRVTLAERARLRDLYPEAASIVRPVVRADCVGGHRPCPFVGCRWHLYLEVIPKTGSIRLNFPAGTKVEDLDSSCALDVADLGGSTLEAVGSALHLTRERVRQIEERAKDKLAMVDGFLDLVAVGLEP
jgi:hypothetical protein